MGTMDHVILHLFRKELTASEMQFGFKKYHSTTLCSLIFTEVISTYVNNNSSVYSCLLDASKAFDLVHYGKLFKKFISKDLPKSVIRLYFDNYLRQISCVIWRDYKSEYFNVSNGVKQGGVISPIFFSLYIDPLLLALNKSQIGCHMNNVYMGTLSYTDDITIIYPSIRG